jgi:hypothetical protein
MADIVSNVRKLDDRDNTVRLIRHEAQALVDGHPWLSHARNDGNYRLFAEHVAEVAGDLLALSNHLKSKLEPKRDAVPDGYYLDYFEPGDKPVLKPLPAVKPRSRRKPVPQSLVPELVAEAATNPKPRTRRTTK